ncbi:Rrf2 family transcriptional regulator [Frateuria aurantia]
MRNDSRLSRVLHVLLHMQQAEGPLTSEAMAGMLRTNPVVVRRLLAGLRDCGYVRSEKGHGGGWVLGAALGDITLLDVYRSAGEPALFSDLVSEDNPNCLIERAVNARLSQAVRDAERALLEQFAGVTLAQLAMDVEPGAAAGAVTIAETCIRCDGPS